MDYSDFLLSFTLTKSEMPDYLNSVLIRALAIWAAALMLGPLALAADDLPSLKTGEDYGAVRTKMIRAGWKPFHAPDADRCGSEDARCANRPEMVVCAGTGLANCKFLWKKSSRTVALCTAGETRAVFTGVCRL
ncbi:hypothetical protein GNX71_20050 [Variovorax sp. RKNM96]|uniref:hypothetical protein n=1 Tax=Variovorax sp. RKNM96 TaxID=2681552 RepID=UPI00197D8FD9|nr:hypothetical protein [Variovorax sp. RKNM96]QSI31747.1 hypothetical protein GNX71_20050 [Variovorax sp. RKNM96]